MHLDQVNIESLIQSMSKSGNWVEHVYTRLRRIGIDGFIQNYDKLVQQIENKRCEHSSNFNECCGISYEYLNDISVRSILEEMKPHLPVAALEVLNTRLAPIDHRLKALCEKRKNQPFLDRKPTAKYWWKYLLPDGIEE